jgi:hypothetical protein
MSAKESRSDNGIEIFGQDGGMMTMLIDLYISIIGSLIASTVFTFAYEVFRREKR